MSPLTTHVLDTARGMPAVGVPICLERRDEAGSFHRIAEGKTNEDGRLPGLLEEGQLQVGVYRMTFDIETWEKGLGQSGFYPYAQVVFRVEDTGQHHHVPLLLSPYGYSTYRGS